MPRCRNVRARVDWRDFAGGRVVLPVCPRSPAVRGRNFVATLEALSARVRHAHVVLCDTLDRHNDNTRDGSKAASRGDEWLAGSLHLFAQHGLSYDLRRWSDVTSDPGFAARHRTLLRMYECCGRTRRVVHDIARFYLESHSARGDSPPCPAELAARRRASAAYLLEEFAGTAVYKEWYPGLPEVYWGVYVEDVDVLDRLNRIDPAVDLRLPVTLPVWNNRLGPSTAGERTRGGETVGRRACGPRS